MYQRRSSTHAHGALTSAGFYVFLIEERVNTMWDASMSLPSLFCRDRDHFQSNAIGIRSRAVDQWWNPNDDGWRGGKTNNSFSRWNVIYNKHIVRVSFADIFFSLILKLFAHRTKIHNVFFLFVVSLFRRFFIVAAGFIVAREEIYNSAGSAWIITQISVIALDDL